MQAFWDSRYQAPDYAYGETPNAFFAQELAKLQPGRLLLPAEGEGRNAVYAAKLGWEATAFDYSAEGRQKALRLAEKAGVALRYQLLDVADYVPEPESFEAIGLCFTHFPPALRDPFFAKMVEALAPGGVLILEGFHTQQLGYHSGGPKDASMLFSVPRLAASFAALDIQLLHDTLVHLDEGPFHQGPAHVVQLIAHKKPQPSL
jgi:SAM-dependent methyltransferase